jgi:hypothetical protein
MRTRSRHAQIVARTEAVPQTARFSVVARSKSRQEQAGRQAAAISGASSDLADPLFRRLSASAY